VELYPHSLKHLHDAVLNFAQEKFYLFNSIRLFVYLRAEHNSQWPVTESAQIQTIIANNTNQGQNSKKQGKMDQLRLFTFKHELLKICVHLQIAFAAETHLAEGHSG
jgi:hypothetical protein